MWLCHQFIRIFVREYVIIGNNYGTNWDGKHPSETLDFALNTEEIANIIDIDKIAIGGHSQGGMGTFNAINEYAYAYKLDNIKIPTMLIAGTYKFDSETVSPLSEMEKTYNELNGDKE